MERERDAVASRLNDEKRRGAILERQIAETKRELRGPLYDELRYSKGRQKSIVRSIARLDEKLRLIREEIAKCDL